MPVDIEQGTEELSRPDGRPELCVIVVSDSVCSTHQLPEQGRLTIGRSQSCDIRIDQASISRQHAILHVGPTLRIEDLGSANGTVVRGEHIVGKIVVVAPGDTIEIGRSILLVQKVSTARQGSRPVVDELAKAQGRDSESARQRPGRPTLRDTQPSLRSDDTMQELYRLVARVAAGTINVLLIGETGAGKEIVAEQLHRTSPRAAEPFLRLNCAALSESLLESELFGHERGAFTGAVESRPGLLETADGGTVFLDEVGELPPAIQVKLLRVIEEQMVLPVGGRKPRKIDVRFVSATNRDLEKEVAAGTFRQDLFFRLNGILIVVPPLRERASEIVPLAKGFVASVCEKMQRTPVPMLSPETLEQLQRHQWPGNVRELRNVMERAVLLCSGETIEPEHLSLDKLTNVEPAASTPDERARVLEEQLEENERARIMDALERAEGNQTRASKLLGVSRGTLMAWLDRYSLPRPRKKG
jgi:transcriptional regulator with PAS, ATPase and Fis domain